MPFLIKIFAMLLISLPAQAQVFKCMGQDGTVVYADSPCSDSEMQTLPDIATPPPPQSSPKLASKPAVIQQLDTAVKAAIALNDLNRAEALATTQEHWEWIADARKNTPRPTHVESLHVAESAECQQAKSQLDFEAGRPFPDPEVLQSKRSLMYASCGIPEPVEVVTEAPAVGFFPYHNYPYAYPRHPHRFPHARHPHWQPKPPTGYTSQPYDRHKERPFGSRFIRPEETRR